MKKQDIEERNKKIIQEIKAGEPVEVLTKRYGLCAGHIYKIKKKHGGINVKYNRRPNLLVQGRKARILRMFFEEHIQVKEIAIQTGESIEFVHGTIYKASIIEKVPKRTILNTDLLKLPFNKFIKEVEQILDNKLECIFDEKLNARENVENEIKKNELEKLKGEK